MLESSWITVQLAASQEGLSSMKLIYLCLVHWLCPCTYAYGRGNVVPVRNWLSTMPLRHIGEWRYSSTILDLNTGWRWVVSFTLKPLYTWGISPCYPLGRRVGGPQSWSGRCEVEKNLLPLSGIEPRPSSPYPVAIVHKRTVFCYLLCTIDAKSFKNTPLSVVI
jgi:hypothetical protein